MQTTFTPDREHLADLLNGEVERFRAQNQKSQELSQASSAHFLASVPMPWMTRWPGPFPLFMDSAAGARCKDVDGHEYIDFCMGDTGAMTGHSIRSVTRAVKRQSKRGLTTMLPSSDAVWVANELHSRFGMDKWQLAMTATDANRFILRIARYVTGKPKIAVIDWCYHGTVDETLVVRDEIGNTISRPGAIGPQVNPAETTRVVPFNDLEALDAVLSNGDVAVLLMEPALTNIGIVLPDDGYHEAVRAITRKHGVLLAIDETHTICVGPGGATRAWNLEPDLFVIGKPIAGGIPAAAYGMTNEVANRVETAIHGHEIDVSGIGGTLTGSALALAAIRATLETSLREDDFKITIPLATRWAEGVRSAYTDRGLDWHVQQLGGRAEYWFCPPPRSGADAAASGDAQMEAYLHLYALNRGVLLTPFHNMALMSPFHTSRDVDRHTEIFAESIAQLSN
jgi:glutamate-1-semialdehyde 2,1-aminomutase